MVALRSRSLLERLVSGSWKRKRLPDSISSVAACGTHNGADGQPLANIFRASTSPLPEAGAARIRSSCTNRPTKRLFFALFLAAQNCVRLGERTQLHTQQALEKVQRSP